MLLFYSYGGFDLWGSKMRGLVVQSLTPGCDPSEIISSFVDKPVKLVMKVAADFRKISEEMPFDHSMLSYEQGSSVRYADFAPFLLASTASIEV